MAVGARADDHVWLATVPPDQPIRWQSATADPIPERIQHGTVPLGSLWKLFAWTYLVGNDVPERPYVCSASQPRVGEEYCCEPGQQIDRDLALIRSCGAYFAPKRLGLQDAAWRTWWQKQAPHSAWLHDLSNQRPDFHLPVSDILHALQQVPVRERGLARTALQGRLLQPKWQGFLAEAGGAYRFKTFTWENPSRPGSMLGGGAGWLASGQPFWIGGEGPSLDVMQRAGTVLPALLPPPAGPAPSSADTGACVDVRFFAHYPLQAVLDSRQQPVTTPGHLNGRFQALFVNGNRIAIDSERQLLLSWDQAKPRLSARFALEEYIARVLDREADARETAAARALTVAARSWLLQNARFEHGCWQVDDDSRMQRVSPNPPTEAAWRAAWFTEGLVLQGQAVTYHLSRSDDGRLSWQQAVGQARNRRDYVQILAAAFPHASFAQPDGQASCRRLPQAEEWLRRNLIKARESLYGEPGFEPAEAVQVCLLNYGNPYSDQRQQRIWIRRLNSLDDRITLWHEYLHLAFRDHPNGRNENHIEHLAQHLAEAI